MYSQPYVPTTTVVRAPRASPHSQRSQRSSRSQQGDRVVLQAQPEYFYTSTATQDVDASWAGVDTSYASVASQGSGYDTAYTSPVAGHHNVSGAYYTPPSVGVSSPAAASNAGYYSSPEVSYTTGQYVPYTPTTTYTTTSPGMGSYGATGAGPSSSPNRAYYSSVGSMGSPSSVAYQPTTSAPVVLGITQAASEDATPDERMEVVRKRRYSMPGRKFSGRGAIAGLNKYEVLCWLTEIGMGEYAPDFAQHEVTGVALSSMKDKDIKEVGVTKMGHRLLIQDALRFEAQIQRLRNEHEDVMNELSEQRAKYFVTMRHRTGPVGFSAPHFKVGAWLRSIGYGRYAPLFARNKVDGLVILLLGDKDLDAMGIKDMTDQKRIMYAIDLEKDLEKHRVDYKGKRTKLEEAFRNLVASNRPEANPTYEAVYRALQKEVDDIEDMRGASKINKKIEEKKAISDALSQPSVSANDGYMYDLNNDGNVDMAELAEGFELNDRERQMIEEAAARIDDGDGNISYQEFAEAYNEVV